MISFCHCHMGLEAVEKCYNIHHRLLRRLRAEVVVNYNFKKSRDVAMTSLDPTSVMHARTMSMERLKAAFNTVKPVLVGLALSLLCWMLLFALVFNGGQAVRAFRYMEF
jgi:hypothetical protein